MTARVHACGGVARVKPLVRSLPFVALLGPALLVLAALALYPVAQVLVDSFCRVDYAAGRRAFAGLANYRAVLGDDAFSAGFGNTLRFTIVASLAEVALGFGLALLFVRAFPGRRIALPLAILPMMLSTLVCSAIWRNWLNFDGFLNALLAALGIEGVRWLSDPHLALWSLALVDVWQWTPMAFLIVLAGLQSIPHELYEAARTDGASEWQCLRDITLPLAAPQIGLALLLRSIDTFKLFDKVYALTGGGPGNATQTLSTYIYDTGFRFFDVGTASAASVLMLAASALLVSGYVWQTVRKRRA
ncbi:TPA: sugar ABC transporter permease [Burkholderia vietnamiensis]|uniref:Sugar ABC transporter permease n=1 Tax=Burkholderia vietnamiensis TaxID=60552 RepID=A0AA44XYR0_BURVI|nr:sugar ABC transporter permease [Burkholderia vietnamiensis]MBR8031313.1 sugar ABC transporter permease [Burkholderia vietnamiensis]MCA8206683.1 sugar ABC transporter permease [Burkholderia vietnamiensis]PRH40704.1 sugar ABC transporter permease [Burkholderia vietnamiensis]HDR9038076.1 sugar ABC transporter permease [Burkholderia vietnamiensis]HDR9096765.1 sugar ABC transporter permease [Burkholderia vietnamiensis]